VRVPPGTAWKLLERYGSLRALGTATPHELQAHHGLGPVTALRLTAALALGRRARAERLPRGRLLRESAEIFAAFHERLRDLKKERFVVVMLDCKNRVIREDLVSEGILTASLVHPREVFAPAIREAAAGIVLVHNHPSGDPEPSPEDHEVTARLCAVGELVGIRVLDHVIVGDGCYVSFLERGLIDP
jgi:DNA repair protein RadC